MAASRREELVEAAVRVFYRHGFHASGVERVLEEGGLARMTLYNHFRSKEDLIVAALRRRDEVFRNRMARFVESRGEEGVGRVLAVFDFHEQWFEGNDFCGCMFINASAEFGDPESGPRLAAADHKRAVHRYLVGLCRGAGVADPEWVAEELGLLLEGAIVTAQVSGKVERDGTDAGRSARLARRMAERVLREAGRAAGEGVGGGAG